MCPGWSSISLCLDVILCCWPDHRASSACILQLVTHWPLPTNSKHKHYTNNKSVIVMQWRCFIVSFLVLTILILITKQFVSKSYCIARMDEFKCSICEKSYSSKDSQKRHEKDQHKQYKSFNCQDWDKRYKCTSCEKVYRSSLGLRRHFEIVHEGIRQRFNCNTCNYSATQKDLLSIHMKSTHLQQKYPCEICDYQATKSCHLTRHVQNVHSKEDVSCRECKKTMKKFSLTKHRKLFHLKSRQNSVATFAHLNLFIKTIWKVTILVFTKGSKEKLRNRKRFYYRSFNSCLSMRSNTARP